MPLADCQLTRFDGASLHMDLPPGVAARAMEANDSDPPVWVLVGNSRGGDYNQLLALAEALGLPYEIKHLKYNRLARFAFLRDRLLHITKAARETLRPPWPDLVVGLGYQSIPVSRFIRRASCGRTQLVHIGNPRTRLDDIDLVLTTPQYSLTGANVVRLPFPIGNPALVRPTDEEARWLRKFSPPRRLIAVGGPTPNWRLDTRELEWSIAHLQDRGAQFGGSVIAVTSRRTPARIQRLLERRLTGPGEICVSHFPRFAALLSVCDECHVTADSVSMISEAILAGKQVGMIPVERSLKGKIAYWLRRSGWKLRPNADLSRFWSFLADNQLVGSIDAPIASAVPGAVETAVTAVRKVLRRDLNAQVMLPPVAQRTASTFYP